MHKWWKQFTTEWLLLRRNWWMMLAVPAFGLWMVYALANPNVWETPNVYTHVYTFSHIGHTMTLGVAMLLSVLTMRRDTAQRVSEMLETWTFGNGTWLTAKYVALFSYMSLYSVVMVLVALFGYVRDGVPLSIGGEDIGYLFVQYELSYAVTLALGMALATWIRHRIVYLIGFCAWMFGTFFMEVVVIDRSNWKFLKTFHLSEIMRSAWGSSDVWGASIVGDELMRSRLFVLLFTFCLLAAVLITRYSRRPGNGVRLARRTLTLLVVGLVAAGAWYGALWMERYSEYRTARAHYEHDLDEDSETVAMIPFHVEAYDLQVRQTAKREIAVRASLTLDPEALAFESNVVFTLNHTFDIQGIEVNGKAVDFVREWDTFALNRQDLPANAQQWTIVLDYAGKVYHHGALREHFSHFVDGGAMFLPYYIAWYPLPGEQDLYWTFEGEERLMTRRDAIVPGPAHIDLSLDGFPNHVYATLGPSSGKTGAQTFSGFAERGITLVAGKLEEVTYKELRLITSPTNRTEGEQFLKEWHGQVVAYYDTWLFNRDQDRRLQAIFYLPLHFVNSEAAVYMAFEPPTDHYWFLNDDHYHRLTAYTDRSVMAYFSPAQTLITAYLFNDFETFSMAGDEADNVTGAVRTAYIYLYVREQLHESHEQAMYLVGDMFLGLDEEITPEWQVLEMVGQAVDRGEVAQVKELLHDLYETVDQFDPGTYHEQPDQGITWDEWQSLWKECGLSE